MPRKQVILLLLTILAVVACRVRSFEVIPKAPAYLLRSPNAHETPFQEILVEYNGYVRGKPSMDLLPQSELRIENAYYEKGKSRKGLDGYLGTEVARYTVNADGLHLGAVTPMKDRPEWDLAVQDLISEQQLKRHFFRLYFEILFNRKSGAHGSVLLAADSSAELGNLSTQLETDPESVCNEKTTAQCTVFPEACSVSVEIPIIVNAQRQMITWGSLLSNVVTQPPQSLLVQRLYRGHLTKVMLDLHDQLVLSLPLLPGDHIDWK